ncbi:facilitated trehalose transporter Tret1-like isoform X1 [Maniola hyperantus]|uniref:facilitated trehalose transporter Tret1-like isoform X1 n=3 Tax=Aphantopus hyperantus TaxID=2795564 RepID=UPI0015682492|nr:facilitated trehalose transporter Tret1-like [Maniola hyperantus]
MAILNQILATGVMSYVCTTMGIMYTWPSFTIKLFSSTNTTLDRVMTETEIALLGSISSISAIIITPFSSYLLDTLGRKWCCIVFYMAQLIGWVIIIIWYSVEAVLFAMFLSGLSACMMLVIPLYVSEYCQESIRGSMTSGSMIFFGIGMLFSYLLGGLLEYKMMNYTGLTLTVLGLVIFSFMRESPLFLMQKGRETEAARSIAFYRGMKIGSKEVLQEIENIRRTLNPDIGDTENPREEEKLNPEGPKKKLSPWKYLVKSRSSRRALLLSIMLYSTSIFQGLIVVQVYAELLFERAIPSMSAMVSSVLFAIVVVIAGFFGAYLIDLVGRRPLIMYASFATGICCAVLGSQIHLNWGPNWLTAVFIYVYCVTYIVGAGTVPYVIVAEIFLPEIKSFASMVAVEWAFTCNFIILFIFNPLVNFVGLGPVFYLFSVICFLTVVYCYYYLPETKGLPVDAMQKRFLKRANLL